MAHVLHGHFHSYTCEHRNYSCERRSEEGTEENCEKLSPVSSLPPSLYSRLIPSRNFFPPRVWRGSSLNRNDVNRSTGVYIYIYIVPINGRIRAEVYIGFEGRGGRVERGETQRYRWRNNAGGKISLRNMIYIRDIWKYSLRILDWKKGGKYLERCSSNNNNNNNNNDFWKEKLWWPWRNLRIEHSRAKSRKSIRFRLKSLFVPISTVARRFRFTDRNRFNPLPFSLSSSR